MISVSAHFRPYLVRKRAEPAIRSRSRPATPAVDISGFARDVTWFAPTSRVWMTNWVGITTEFRGCSGGRH
jgi:hypothetical protein